MKVGTSPSSTVSGGKTSSSSSLMGRHLLPPAYIITSDVSTLTPPSLRQILVGCLITWKIWSQQDHVNLGRGKTLDFTTLAPLPRNFQYALAARHSPAKCHPRLSTLYSHSGSITMLRVQPQLYHLMHYISTSFKLTPIFTSPCKISAPNLLGSPTSNQPWSQTAIPQDVPIMHYA